jgi:small-conductance mechanosensitive channel
LDKLGIIQYPIGSNRSLSTADIGVRPQKDVLKVGDFLHLFLHGSVYNIGYLFLKFILYIFFCLHTINMVKALTIGEEASGVLILIGLCVFLYYLVWMTMKEQKKDTSKWPLDKFFEGSTTLMIVLVVVAILIQGYTVFSELAAPSY